MPGGEGSITVCLGELRAGNEDAVRAFLDRYRGPLEEYARQKLRRLGASRAVADEQDVAQEALLAVIDGIRKQKFDRLRDRDDLIRLLRSVTRRAALKVKRYQEARIRARRRVEVEAEPEGAAVGLRWTCRTEEALARVAGRERGPEEVAAIREEFLAMLAVLADDLDRHLLLLMLEGYTQAEIAERFDCCKRTITLRYQRVREAIQKRAT